MRQKHSLTPARRVALAFPTRFAHLTSVMRGITNYARSHGRWVLTTGGERFDLPIETLKDWPGDGILAVLRGPADAAVARRMKVPVVTFVGVTRDPGIPRVMVDQTAVGGLAAEHLITRGFRRFAFYGLGGAAYSEDREREFARRLAAHDFTVERYHTRSDGDQQWPWSEMEDLRRWLLGLPTPIGLFATNDQRARIVIDACQLIGRRVPEDVGVIGVDNDEIACEFGDPTLTSIACDWRTVGFESAKLLDGLMRGEPAPAADLLIAPTGVVSRESTDVTIVDHPDVARAVAYARDHLGEPFGVEALVTAAGVSRRHLEMAFARSLGCTPATFLARLRSERAKELLDRGGRTLIAITRECGFSDPRHFMRAFERTMRMTPQQYQKAAAARWHPAPPPPAGPTARASTRANEGPKG